MSSTYWGIEPRWWGSVHMLSTSTRVAATPRPPISNQASRICSRYCSVFSHWESIKPHPFKARDRTAARGSLGSEGVCSLRSKQCIATSLLAWIPRYFSLCIAFSLFVPSAFALHTLFSLRKHSASCCQLACALLHARLAFTIFL